MSVDGVNPSPPPPPPSPAQTIISRTPNPDGSYYVIFDDGSVGTEVPMTNTPPPGPPGGGDTPA